MSTPARTTRSSTKGRDPEGARERSVQSIQAAALSAFGERGVEATTMDEIARRAGVSKGLIYVYFESKQALLRAVMEEPIHEAFRTFQDVPQHVTPEEKLRYIVQRTLRDRTEKAELYRLYYALLFTPGQTSVVREIQEELRPGFREVFGALVQIFRELGSEDAEGAARLFQAALIGLTHLLVLRTETGPDLLPLQRLGEQLVIRFTWSGEVDG